MFTIFQDILGAKRFRRGIAAERLEISACVTFEQTLADLWGGEGRLIFTIGCGFRVSLNYVTRFFISFVKSIVFCLILSKISDIMSLCIIICPSLSGGSGGGGWTC